MLFLWNQPVGPERWRFVVDKKLKNLHTKKMSRDKRRKKKRKEKKKPENWNEKTETSRAAEKFLLLELHLAM